MLLAEANQWPEDAVAYFGEGDECHMAFHFPVMPRLFMALQMEDRFPIIDILQQTPAIPEKCQWATFLRNHDELTLEMVTDEDRDYMYRVYASDPQARINLGIRRRLAPLMGNNRRRIELMNALLFSLPGTPIVYYGDEIGMGDNIYLGDRHGVRTPMHWSPDRNAGFSYANPQRLYAPVIIDPEYHHEALNVEAQQNNPHSLLWWMKHLIDLRKQYRALGRGTLRFLSPENPRVLAFVRQWGDERILVVANLSRFAQAVELDLAEFQGTVPIEMFGRTPFPTIGGTLYLVTLSPHAFYWFLLPVESPQRPRRTPGAAPAISFQGTWQELVQGSGQERLEAVLPVYLRGARWFRSKAREIASVAITEVIPVPVGDEEVLLTLVEAKFLDGDAELYVVPFAFAEGERAREVSVNAPGSIVAFITESGLLYDASTDEAFANAMVEGISRRRRWRMPRSELIASRTGVFAELNGSGGPLRATALKSEQTNTSVNLGDRFIFKLFRKVDPGLNPDLEIGRHLTDEARFAAAPRLAGGLELRTRGREPFTLGVLHQFVPSEGDAWGWTQNALSQFFERALVASAPPGEGDLGPPSLVARAQLEPPPVLTEVAGADPSQVNPPGPAHRRAPLRDAGRGRQRGLRHRAVHGPVPALALSVAPHPHAQHLRPVATATVRTARADPGRRPRGAGCGGRAPASGAGRAGAAAHLGPHPHSRRLPSRAGALHREGFRHSRFRGRTEPQPQRAAVPALAAPGRRGHDPVLRVRCRVCPAERPHTIRGRTCRAPVGSPLGPVDLRDVPARLPRGRGQRRLPAQ